MTDLKITSQAQLSMFERAAADPDYARARGIDGALATRFLDAHRAAGAPQLPARAGSVAPMRAKPRSINDRPKGFGPR